MPDTRMQKEIFGAFNGMEDSIDMLASRTLPETLVKIENIILFFQQPPSTYDQGQNPASK